MALLADIKTRILTLGISGYPAAQVYRGEMRPSPDNGIALHQYPGNAPELGFARPGFLYENPGLQVTVRGGPTDYDGPREVIYQIWRDLPKVQDTVLGTTRYLMIRANQHPFLLERDGNQRCVWAVNFICETEVPE
jgi:hypothetical protein